MLVFFSLTTGKWRKLYPKEYFDLQLMSSCYENFIVSKLDIRNREGKTQNLPFHFREKVSGEAAWSLPSKFCLPVDHVVRLTSWGVHTNYKTSPYITREKERLDMPENGGGDGCKRERKSLHLLLHFTRDGMDQSPEEVDLPTLGFHF